MIAFRKSKYKKLMDALEKAHSASVHFRKSLNTDDELREAFSFSFRLSELLRDVGDIRIKEIANSYGCNHQSDGYIYPTNPPQNKCIKCGEFYR